MTQTLAQLSLLVKDYDEAIDFFKKKLGFDLIEDTQLTDTKRWVVVAPGNSSGGRLLLARAVGIEQLAAVGNQAGGRVFLFLYTDDFWRDYKRYTAAGIIFMRPPAEEPYGTVAVFKDLYGNLWDLIQPHNSQSK